MSAIPSSTLPLSLSPRPTYDHSAETIALLTSHLESHAIEYSTIPDTLHAVSHTPHSHAPGHLAPALVAYPTSTLHVSQILKFCHEHGVAVTSISGGTSLGGALTATRKGGVCLDFGRMDGVGEVNGGDGDVRVGAGVEWVGLNERLEKYVCISCPAGEKMRRLCDGEKNTEIDVGC